MKISGSKIKQKFIHLKSKVIALRKLGRTYSEIRKIYNIPKSTLSDWFKKDKIPLKIKKEIQKRGYEKWRKTIGLNAKRRMEEARRIHLKIQNEAQREIKNIKVNGLRLIGVALYWAEGSKKNRNQLRFSNSDSGIIKIIMKFFREICNIPDEKIKARIHLYPGINQQKASNYWKKITGLARRNFHPPQIQVSRASKSKRPRNTLPYGTLHLTVCSSEITCKVKGWIEGISKKV